MDALWYDLRYTARMLMRSPGFTAVAVLTLALGIGANTVIFSLVNTVLLRPPRVGDPSRLVTLYSGMSHTSYPNFRDFREFARHSGVFTDVAGHRNRTLNLGSGERAERAFGELVTGNYFAVLGVAAQRGRVFGPEVDTNPEAGAVVVVSHSFWKRHFGGRDDAVGASLSLNGRPFTVVGVAPEGFTGTYAFAMDPDMYVPMSMYGVLVPDGARRFEDRAQALVAMVARLKPGIAQGQAQAAALTFAGQLKQRFPKENSMLDQTRLYALFGVGAFRGMSFAPVLFVFLGLLTLLVGIVLLIACANLANLLLARAWNRQKEVAVRAALGAGRGRLARQFLTESVLLSLLGGAAGCQLAFWLVGLARGWRPAVPAPIEFQFALDWRVLAYTAALSILAGILFGMAPALHLSKPNLAMLMKEGASRAGRGERRLSFRNLLIVGQVGASLVLLVCAGLFVRSLANARLVDPGFDTDHTLTAAFNVEPAGYDRARGTVLMRDLLERLRQVPGVEAASIANIVPLSLNSNEMPLHPEGKPQDQYVQVLFNSIGADYFRTMRIPMLAGRDFRPQDTATAPRVAIINQTLARRAFGDQDPLGRRLRTPSLPNLPGDWYEVVGVVADSKYRTAGEDAAPIAYFDFEQYYEPEMVLHARVAGDPASFRALLRQVVAAAEPALVVDVATMRDDVALALIPSRIAAWLLASLGALGLLLASVGIYGVISYSAAQRTHEVGIRIAVGATPRDIFRLVVGHGVTLAAVGVAAGLAVAAAVASLLSSMLVGVSRFDPLTYGAVAALLLGVSALACFVPARRSVRVDPMVALRAE